MTEKTTLGQPLGTPDLVPIDRLLLDAENPRLSSAERGTTQKDLLKTLWSEMAVDEVALSIANNGYFPEEPLFVIPEDPKVLEPDRKYVVVEGNRRLAAVKLLREERLRSELKATDIPAISDKARSRLDKLPVSKYQTRRELWEYYGFRHINGPREWDAYSKAQFVSAVREKYGIPLDEIADKIGDRHSTVVRLYRGVKLLEQAERQTRFSKEDRIRNRFYFSHLYTAADQSEFQAFLGIDPKKSLRPNPVPRSRIPYLEEFLLWLYGSKERRIEPVVRTQNPDLNLLREVIRKPKALAALRVGYPLHRAFEIALGDTRRFRDALTRGKVDLQEAKATVTTGYKGEGDLFETIKDIVDIAQSLKDEMARQKQV